MTEPRVPGLGMRSKC